MALQINYDNLVWNEPPGICTWDLKLAIIKWCLQHVTVGGNWLNFAYRDKSDAEIGALVTRVPELTGLTQDLLSFRTILYLISQVHRLSPEQLTDADAMFTAKDAGLKAVLQIYNPDARPDAS